MTATPDNAAADPRQTIAEVQRKLDARTAERNESIAQQAATAEVLKVIASSPSDVQPVFEAIAISANRLLSGFSTTVFRFIDGALHLMAFTPTNSSADEILKASFPAPVANFPTLELVHD